MVGKSRPLFALGASAFLLANALIEISRDHDPFALLLFVGAGVWLAGALFFLKGRDDRNPNDFIINHFGDLGIGVLVIALVCSVVELFVSHRDKGPIGFGVIVTFFCLVGVLRVSIITRKKDTSDSTHSDDD